MNKPLMCHVVAGYPSADVCLRLMRGIHEAGAAAIEVQIPFSDPIADGETIMHANDAALAGGMTTAGSFELIGQARKQGVDCDVYIMSYLQKVQHMGLEEFCRQAEKCRAKGLIIPDLPFESIEYSKLVMLTRKYKLELVPVLSPGMVGQRLKALLEANTPRVYVTSQRGITGNSYAGSKDLEQMVSDIRRQSDTAVMVGFGIATSDDVDDALKVGDIAIVGSAIIKRLQTSDLEKTLDYIGTLVRGN